MTLDLEMIVLARTLKTEGTKVKINKMGYIKI
jgi:hypothetical protein